MKLNSITDILVAPSTSVRHENTPNSFVQPKADTQHLLITSSLRFLQSLPYGLWMIQTYNFSDFSKHRRHTFTLRFYGYHRLHYFFYNSGRLQTAYGRRQNANCRSRSTLGRRPRCFSDPHAGFSFPKNIPRTGPLFDASAQRMAAVNRLRALG